MPLSVPDAPPRDAAADPLREEALRLRCLDALRDALADVVIPDLTSASAITAGHLALRMVNHLIAANGEALTLNRPDPDAEGLAEAWRALDIGDAGILSDDAAFAHAVPQIVGDAAVGARNFLNTLAEAQKSLLVRMDPDAERGVADMYLGGRKAETFEKRKEERELLTADSLTAYLRHRFPECPERRVVALTVLPGGMSKQTIRVSTEDSGRQESFILRQDLKLSPADRTVVDEFPVLQSVWAAGGVPLAEPLWIEADPRWFGTPLIAVGFVEGENGVSAWASDPVARTRFTESLSAALARLHTIVPPGAERLSTREHVAAEIDWWYSGWKRWEVQPRPLMEATFAWLRDNIPLSTRRPSLVHGDVGFHNMLNKDGEITAMLDWEFSHVGDAAADLVYARPFIETVLDWPSFVAAYVRHGGTAPTEEEERFYAVWGSARNAAGCGGALSKFVHHPEADMRLGVSGMTFLARFELDAFERAIGE